MTAQHSKSQEGRSQNSLKTEDPTLINLTDILIILRQRWIHGASIGLLVSAAFVIFFMSRVPQFEATSSMIVEFNTDQIVNVQEVVDAGVQNSSLFESVMNTHIQRLKGASMASYVGERLSPEESKILQDAHPMDDIEVSTLEEPRPNAALISPGRLGARWLPDSQVIQVSYRHPKPEVARLLANAYVRTYISLQLDLRSRSTDQAVEFLDDQTVELRKQLEAEEQALQQYRAEYDLVTVEQNQAIINERLGELSSAITGTRVRLLGLESRIRQIESAGDTLEQLMNIPFIGGRQDIRTIYAELQKLQREQEVLTQRYLERHPRMVELATSIESTRESLNRAVTQARREIEIERETASDELASIEKEFAASEAEALRLEELSINYRVLQRKVDSRRQTFDLVNTRFNETSIAQQLNLTSIRPLESAGLPKSPVSPNVKKVGAIGIALFLAIFIALPIGMEFLDNRLKTFADIESYIGKPVIGDIAAFASMNDRSMARLASSEDYEHSEPFDSIYGALRLQLSHFETPLSFVVTSSVPGEGKTVIATNMAQILAKHQFKTLVIDCDLRRPSVHRYLDFPNERGLLHWLRSSAPLPEDPLQSEELGIHALNGSGTAFALAAGGSTKQAAPVYEEPRFDQLVSKLKQHFDILIFDTPPVGLFHDATFVADYADHCIFVARQNATTRQKTRHSVQLMERSESKVLGVVFNGINDQGLAAGYGYGNSGSGSYGYGYNYGDRYSYGRGKGKQASARYYEENS